MAKGQGRKPGITPTFIERRKRKKTITYKVDKTQCKKCLYRPIQGFEANFFGCAYILFTGHRRPSEPSPNCTAFKLSTRSERMNLIKEMKEKYQNFTFVGKGE